MNTSQDEKDVAVACIEISEREYVVNSHIARAKEAAEQEILSLQETIDSVGDLKPQCDKLDYALAASSGAVCGILDVFLVGAPGESPFGDITDSWFANRTKDFAKMYGWKGPRGDADPTKSAIGFLERHFKVPYDQRGVGDAASAVLGDITPSNHHFKSLAHNPSLVGLFFSILDQFTGSSHFVDDRGQLIELVDVGGEFELHGNSVPAKFFCAFSNWFGHVMSDISGSSGGAGRGKGFPSPLWTWMNSVIAIKNSLGIPVSDFNKAFNELALEIYKQGYDVRFQSAQAIPVLINGMLVRLLYATRRLVKYYKDTPESKRSFHALWQACAPFSNPTIKRMLTVAHGTFCLVDAGDATARAFVSGAGYFNPVEFVLRLNVVGVGRFAISLYGEAKDQIKIHDAEIQAEFSRRKQLIIKDYIAGLNQLAELYDDHDLVNLVEQLQTNPRVAFEKSVKLADKRGVADGPKTKEDIDNYFIPNRV